MKVLILGITGMLGHVLFEQLSRHDELEVYGTVRSANKLSRPFFAERAAGIIEGVDGLEFDTIQSAVEAVKPHRVINAIGIVKQLPAARDPLLAIPVNALLPHKLARLCAAGGSRLIHISTDCVFSGQKGNYTETDFADAGDLYGRTKYLGEVDYPHCVTMRTSIIGHELNSRRGLVEWFLSQEGSVRGYTGAVYSGLPTVELARVIAEYVIPDGGLSGLYHVASPPVTKFNLLSLIAQKYNKDITIEAWDEVQTDLSLEASGFKQATGYDAPSWPWLIDAMYRHFMTSPCYRG